jgi:hypothetical protein
MRQSVLCSRTFHHAPIKSPLEQLPSYSSCFRVAMRMHHITYDSFPHPVCATNHVPRTCTAYLMGPQPPWSIDHKPSWPSWEHMHGSSSAVALQGTHSRQQVGKCIMLGNGIADTGGGDISAAGIHLFMNRSSKTAPSLAIEPWLLVVQK